MPPASRGFFRPRSPIFVFIRTNYTGRTDTRKIRPPKHKSPPPQGPVRTPMRESPGKFPLKPVEVQAKRRTIPPGARRFIGNMIIAVPIIVFAVTHIPFSVMSVTGGSMRPLFNPNTDAGDEVETKDKMLVTMSGHYRIGDIARGEIIVFKTPHDPNKIAVKRVVALAGDKVLPLPGYEGTEEEQNGGVVVGYNHMWVEGDVDDRNKSIDSNWYGPICQNLVIGRATLLLSPWYWPRWITVSDHSWPAEESKRVKYNAVEDATKDPDHVSTGESFKDGKVEYGLKYMRENKEKFAAYAADESKRSDLLNLYQQMRNEMKKNNADTIERASDMVRELEAAFYRAGGFIENPVFPEMKLVVMQEAAESETVGTAKAKPADARSQPSQRVQKASRQLEKLEQERKELEQATERAKQQLQGQLRQS